MKIVPSAFYYVSNVGLFVYILLFQQQKRKHWVIAQSPWLHQVITSMTLGLPIHLTPLTEPFLPSSQKFRIVSCTNIANFVIQWRKGWISLGIKANTFSNFSLLIKTAPFPSIQKKETILNKDKHTGKNMHFSWSLKWCYISCKNCAKKIQY